MRSPRAERFLYVIGSDRDGDPVKIGVASDAKARLRFLQTGSPTPLRLLAVHELTPSTVRKAEADCPRALAPRRQHGECFAVPADEALRVVAAVVERRPWDTWDRKCSLNMRTTDGERAAIVALAKSEGLPVTTFIVWLLRREAKERGLDWPG